MRNQIRRLEKEDRAKARKNRKMAESGDNAEDL